MILLPYLYSSRPCSMESACVWSVVALWTSFSSLHVFDYVDLETKTLQGAKGENSLSSTGIFLVDNSSVDFQKFPDKEILRMVGPLTADFIVKVSPINYLVFKPPPNWWYLISPEEKDFKFWHRFVKPIIQDMFNSRVLSYIPDFTRTHDFLLRS